MRRLLLTSFAVLALLMVAGPAAGAAKRGAIDFAAFTTNEDLTAGTADCVAVTPRTATVPSSSTTGPTRAGGPPRRTSAASG